LFIIGWSGRDYNILTVNDWFFAFSGIIACHAMIHDPEGWAPKPATIYKRGFMCLQ
jgi:hypothetical protein